MNEQTRTQIEQFDANHTVCFSGPRPTKLPNGGDDKATPIIQLKLKLEHEIENCLDNKFVFVNGGMAGFDIIAGETVLSLKQRYPNLVCVTIAPFRIGYFANTIWTPQWKQRALKVYKQSDISCCLSDRYYKGVYYERDRFLVSHSSLLICFYAGSGGGTKYTMDFANKNNTPIVNILEGEESGGIYVKITDS